MMGELSHTTAASDPPPAHAPAALLAWGEQSRRSLPWRETRDPWAILVSEVMLQQTQVDRVIPRYHRFLERFPTPCACAAAAVADVVTEWSGLGYNRRAVALHQAASVVVERHGGRLPDELADLLALPGVGPYTARAVLAFAFERDVAVVDTNVGRILARRVGRPLTAREVQSEADSLVPEGQGWAWNQTMLDLGATVCGPRRPGCRSCPFAGSCGWRGDPARADPATGSAAVSGRQSRFAGSDRQGGAALVRALTTGPIGPADLAGVMGWPDDLERARRVAATVVGQRLAVADADGTHHLP